MLSRVFSMAFFDIGFDITATRESVYVLRRQCATFASHTANISLKRQYILVFR